MTQTSPTWLQAFTQKSLLVFATGLIFWLVSEALFYGLVRSTDSVSNYIITVSLYCYAAWLFLILVTHFNIRNKAALFLAGGFFGWTIEGIFVSTMFGIADMPFPLSIPVTGLSWHALLTVMVGLYGTRLALRKRSTTFRLAAFAGIFWGLWAATWRSADASLQVSIESFFLYGCVLTTLFVAGHLLWQRTAQIPLTFKKREIWTAVILTTLWFLLITVPQHPLAALVLPPLLILIYFALKKNKVQESAGQPLPELADQIPITRYAPFAIIPPIASFLYAVTGTIPYLEYNMIVVTVITGCIGTWAFVASLIKLSSS